MEGIGQCVDTSAVAQGLSRRAVARHASTVFTKLSAAAGLIATPAMQRIAREIRAHSVAVDLGRRAAQRTAAGSTALAHQARGLTAAAVGRIAGEVDASAAAESIRPETRPIAARSRRGRALARAGGKLRQDGTQSAQGQPSQQSLLANACPLHELAFRDAPASWIGNALSCSSGTGVAELCKKDFRRNQAGHGRVVIVGRVKDHG